MYYVTNSNRKKRFRGIFRITHFSTYEGKKGCWEIGGATDVLSDICCTLTLYLKSGDT